MASKNHETFLSTLNQKTKEWWLLQFVSFVFVFHLISENNCQENLKFFDEEDQI